VNVSTELIQGLTMSQRVHTDMDRQISSYEIERVKLAVICLCLLQIKFVSLSFMVNDITVTLGN
jgi:hypothetical protein